MLCTFSIWKSSLCVFEYVYVCVCICIYVCMYVGMYVGMYMYIYIYTFTYIYIWSRRYMAVISMRTYTHTEDIGTPKKHDIVLATTSLHTHNRLDTHTTHIIYTYIYICSCSYKCMRTHVNTPARFLHPSLHPDPPLSLSLPNQPSLP